MAGSRAVGFLITGIALLVTTPAAPASYRDTAPYADAESGYFFDARDRNGNFERVCEDDGWNRCSHIASANAETGVASIEDALSTAEDWDRRWQKGFFDSAARVWPVSYVAAKPVEELTFVIDVTVHEMSMRVLGGAGAHETTARSHIGVGIGCSWPGDGLGCGTTVTSEDLPRMEIQGVGEAQVAPGRYRSTYRTAGPFPAGYRTDFHVGPECHLDWRFVDPPSSPLDLLSPPPPPTNGFDYRCRVSATVDRVTVREHGGG